ncbi:protein-glutamate methylesterase/protein-glutamine glutaminase [Halobacillus litoralis]|uniref:protein-glutamate methylesterase/protein-glutamine glutaminase n=1 Tax=Halobacillus litoralis TaxID=45668 RepID=UPI001CFC98AF|nr:chemotaxis response regulator protein-glutamate methylesterase [Halobacillus litoralis]
MKVFRVMIVDDSAFMRRILSDIVNSDPRLTVVGSARNGEDCLRKMAAWDPDVITMDIEMPGMDGLQALNAIMAQCPKPVVMVSSLTKEGADSTMRAMELGAVDFIHKPSGSISLDMKTLEKDVIRKILVAAEAKVAPGSMDVELIKREADIPETQTSQGHLIAIGTSTGGPRALQQVLTTLPENLPAPIVVVQHMPRGFTRSLSERLNKQSAITVKEGEHMEELKNGTAYIAPGDLHMTVIQKRGRLFLSLDETPSVNGHRPSVNRLYTSLAGLRGISVTSVIMTGMGADGLEGLLHLQKACRTYSIAEAETSCVVYGMPKAVVKSGLADEITEQKEISRSIVTSLQIRKG